jgi:hypothetical protein
MTKLQRKSSLIKRLLWWWNQITEACGSGRPGIRSSSLRSFLPRHLLGLVEDNTLIGRRVLDA